MLFLLLTGNEKFCPVLFSELCVVFSDIPFRNALGPPPFKFSFLVFTFSSLCKKRVVVVIYKGGVMYDISEFINIWIKSIFWCAILA